ncbi:MAG: ParB/RepB/Spo0J family partition protein [Nitrospirota bacterium]
MSIEQQSEHREMDRLIEQYVADPQSLSLEEQRRIYDHFLKRVGADDTECEQLKLALQAVDQALDRARQGDAAYRVTPRGTYWRRDAEMKLVPIDALFPSDDNQDLFRDMEGEDFEQLKGSIQELGVIEPLIVDEDMRLICGHQRLRAAKAVGLPSVPVVIRSVGEAETRAMITIEENIRRRQLQPSEMARAIKKLTELKTRAGQVAETVGLSDRQVQRYRSLSDLIPELSVLLDGGTLTQHVAIQLAQLDETAQRELYHAMKDRMARTLEGQKAVEFETMHAGLLKELDGLSAEVKSITQRDGELTAHLTELQQRLDRAEGQVGGEIKAKKLLEEELEKVRAEMYRKVQEKQALIDKLTKNTEPTVVPPADYQALKAENVKLKAALKERGESVAKATPQAGAVVAELDALIGTRLLAIDPEALTRNISPAVKDQLQSLLRKLEAWIAGVKQRLGAPRIASKKS